MNNLEKTTKRLKRIRMRAFVKAAKTKDKDCADFCELIGNVCTKALLEINDPRLLLAKRWTKEAS